MNNPRAVKTLIRNKLASENEETHEWFHEKGITVELQDDYWFLYADRRGHISELSDFCNSIIYRNNELLCYHGKEIKSSTLEEAKVNPVLVWDENSTIFIEYLNGKEVFMFWDKFEEKWVFSDNKKVKTSYRKLIENKIYNIMSLDIIFTYCFRIVESSDKSGIYLERMYNNEKCQEVDWDEVFKTSQRINVGYNDIYKFEGFDKLEQSDFPIYVKDKSANITLLTSIK